MKGIIYRAYLPSGMSYIGQTTDLERRKQHHWYKRKDGHPFHIALKLFGRDAFSWEILEEVEIELLNQREKFWISYFDSYENGYNENLGGQCCRTKEYYEHLTKSLSGKTHSEETKRQISESKKGVPHPHKGQKGRTAWNKGLTKKTDERVAKYAATRWGV